MDDIRDVYALHLVFIPIIQKHLDIADNTGRERENYGTTFIYNYVI